MKDGDPKISDLGIATIMKSSGVTTVLGTRYYLAPETFLSDKFDFAADIWSLGITFLEMLVGDRIWKIL